MTKHQHHHARHALLAVGTATSLLFLGGCVVREEPAQGQQTTTTTTTTTTGGGAYATPAPGVQQGNAAQPARTGGQLSIGGTASNFGNMTMTSGFTPDPAMIRVTSGGTLNAEQAAAGGCAGWVTQQPDVIINFTQMTGFLRFGFRADNSSEDATLVINDPRGNWYCNDDAVGLNPVVDFGDASPGQYDIWVGSYESGAYVGGTLMVTELRDVSP